MIREAVEADIPALLAMGERFHALSPVGKIAPFSPESFERTLRGLIASEDGALFVNPDLTGMIGVVKAPAYFSTVTFAQELFWWSEGGSGLRLLVAAEAWAKARGAVAMLMLRVHGLNERLDGLYRRRGYVPVEHTYSKEL